MPKYWNNFKDRAKHILTNENFEQFISKDAKNLNVHYLKDEIIIDFLRKIRKSHPNLYQSLSQNFLIKINKKTFHNFFQFHFSNGKPIICFRNENQIIPLIFDFNHCFDKVGKNRKYQYSKQVQRKEWDFKSKQKRLKEEIKKYII